jgi:transposase
VRRYLRRRGITAVTPRKRNERPSTRPFDKETHRERNVTERRVSWLKEDRRLATRYEKLGVTFLVMVKLAMIRRCFRVYDSPDGT